MESEGRRRGIPDTSQQAPSIDYRPLQCVICVDHALRCAHERRDLRLLLRGEGRMEPIRCNIWAPTSRSDIGRVQRPHSMLDNQRRIRMRGASLVVTIWTVTLQNLRSGLANRMGRIVVSSRVSELTLVYYVDRMGLLSHFSVYARAHISQS